MNKTEAIIINKADWGIRKFLLFYSDKLLILSYNTPSETTIADFKNLYVSNSDIYMIKRRTNFRSN